MNPSQPKLRLKDRRRRLMWVKVAAGTTVVAVSVALVFYVSHLPSIMIATVDVSGTNLVSADQVRSVASEKLSGSYIYLVPHANVFLAPVRSIVTAIEQSFPPVASVSVSRNNLTTLHVAIMERKPTALWCAGIPSGEISADGNASSTSAHAESGCYLMDSGGFVFAKSSGTEGYVRFYGTLSGNPIGRRYLSGDFASLDTIVKDIGESIHRTPEDVLVDNDSKDVSLAFSEGGILRFIRTTDRQTVLENVASVFGSQGFKQNPDFEYVDFRFGDKVYVKFK
ncbi:MAG: FtsQ-type POTRA domain-containing protein [bacterium]|nr:FtsQ-type POTRA domain-containing protein [bacterium]